MAQKKTHKEYVKEVKKLNSNIEVVETYINAKTKIKHKCKIDQHEWDIAPTDILSGTGCPKCFRDRMALKYAKNHNQYVEELFLQNSNIDVVGNYINTSTKIKHKCKKDNYEWNVAPATLLSGVGCPVCAGKAIGPEPEYKNSIWASQYKDFFALYLNEIQMKTTMPRSGMKIDMVCPDCGDKKAISPDTLLQHGFGCICGDGISFPNKFVYNVLTQLKVHTKTEFTPKWSDSLRYDEYLKDYNLIIENHGMQHYMECSFTNRTLEEEQENDKHKQNLAYKNGISYYIVLDCRKSEMQWIKKSILSSDLPLLLGFSESDIDWDEANRYASTNLTKNVLDLYNNNMTVSCIAKQFGISEGTVYKWLHRSGIPLNDGRMQSVKCIELHKTYKSIAEAERKTGVSRYDITNNINKKSEFAGFSADNTKLHWIKV